MNDRCPASREAVEEQEEYGEVDCPLCGRSAASHPSEEDDASVGGLRL